MIDKYPNRFLIDPQGRKISSQDVRGGRLSSVENGDPNTVPPTVQAAFLINVIGTPSSITRTFITAGFDPGQTLLQIDDFSECSFILDCEYSITSRNATNTSGTGDAVEASIINGNSDPDLDHTDSTPQGSNSDCSEVFPTAHIDGVFRKVYGIGLDNAEKRLRGRFRRYYSGTTGHLTNEVCIREVNVTMFLHFTQISGYEVLNDADNMEITELNIAEE